MTQFDNSYARLPDRFYARIDPDPVDTPEMILFNTDLAETLGVTERDAAVFAGNVVPEGAEPLAQVYAAHQFGGWVPRLGDGRAILLGEVVTDQGRFDIQLKGAGRTPYSRNGDGRAWLGPVLREYIVSEFMAACDVPTTRALAAVATGERVQRERAYPGGVLTRVAASHIRVGTFQYFTAQEDNEAVRLLAEHVRDRHYPQAQTMLDLYSQIVAAQARLIARWMGLGFVHGVMNTDNTGIAGETIDYGPCAFIDSYAPNACYSSIDHHGRYAFDQQANIAGWNLAQLGSCFVGMLTEETGSQDAAVEALTQALNQFPAIYQTAWRETFAAKLGITDPRDGDEDLAQDLLSLMAQTRADFTNVFARLGTDKARDEFTDRPAFDAWAARWHARRDRGPEGAALMARANPQVIPRTHRLEEAIVAATEGDFAKALRLARVLSAPFDLADADRDLMAPPTQDEIVPATFCGT
ncbi:protein adenylyltransferase SelO [Celeribacter sp.]|uniref:protein adenylyltransferase SelO n=1 Tax=Celeribacter sp. TaxID=1890673 RepID=UPI003A95A5E8